MTERHLEQVPARPPLSLPSSFSEEEETQEYRWKGYVVKIRAGYLTKGNQIGTFAEAWAIRHYQDAAQFSRSWRGAVQSYLRAAREEAGKA